MALEVIQPAPFRDFLRLAGVLAVHPFVHQYCASGVTFTANFKAHAAGASIVCRGNPRPKTIYNPHDDPGVVLHMSVIK
jgi:hypothetical protein